jgi:hypothetical protein
MRGRLAVALAAALIACSACGPDRKLAVGLKDYNTDIVFGSQSKPEPPPPLVDEQVAPAVPSFIVPPPPIVDAAGPPTTEPPPPPRPPRVVTCPEIDLAIPSAPATPSISALPKPGTYGYRQTGSYAIGPSRGSFPVQSDRDLTNVTTTSDGRLDSFDVVIAQGTRRQTTTYQVRDTGGGNTVDGLYITRILTEDQGSAPASFTPSDGLRLVAFPLSKGLTWKSTAVDPLKLTAFSIDATAKDIQRVNACGTPVQGWEISVTGSITGIDKSLTLQATYVVAPQLGGLIVADFVTQQGTDQGKDIYTQSFSVLNNVTPRPLPTPRP